MDRRILVFLLIFGLLLTGCSSPNALTRVWDRVADNSQHATNLVFERHPVVQGTLVVLVVGLLVVGAAAYYIWASQFEAGD